MQDTGATSPLLAASMATVVPGGNLYGTCAAQSAAYERSWSAVGPEKLSSLKEQNFNDRGQRPRVFACGCSCPLDTLLSALTSARTLNMRKTYTYKLSSGFTCTLRGWTHTRTLKFHLTPLCVGCLSPVGKACHEHSCCSCVDRSAGNLCQELCQGLPAKQAWVRVRAIPERSLAKVGEGCSG